MGRLAGRSELPEARRAGRWDEYGRRAAFVVVVLAFVGWGVHREVTWDQDTAAYMAVVARHGSALDGAVGGVRGCGPDIASCQAAVRHLREVASSYQDDLARHPPRVTSRAATTSGSR